MSKRREVYGWHVLPLDKKLRYHDGRKVQLNQPLRAYGPLGMCSNGLHASKTPGDALHWWRQIAPGPGWLTIVRLSRERLCNNLLFNDPQKWCARTRTVLGMTKLKVAWENKRFEPCVKRLAKRVGAVLGKHFSIVEVKAKQPRGKKSGGDKAHRGEAR